MSASPPVRLKSPIISRILLPSYDWHFNRPSSDWTYWDPAQLKIDKLSTRRESLRDHIEETAKNLDSMANDVINNPDLQNWLRAQAKVHRVFLEIDALLAKEI